MQQHIERMNNAYAVRAGDILDCSRLDKRRQSLCGQGRGAATRWLPMAVLRGAWSFNHESLRVRKVSTKKRCRRPAASALAASLRTCSMAMRASHSHIQRIRSAVAARFLDLQRKQFDQIVGGYCIYEIALDETEHPMLVDGGS